LRLPLLGKQLQNLNLRFSEAAVGTGRHAQNADHLIIELDRNDEHRLNLLGFEQLLEPRFARVR
jgi:hypothetical protein